MHELSTIQDEVLFRRITSWELDRLSKEVTALSNVRTPPVPMWLQIAGGLIMSGLLGYIGLVHMQALSNRVDIHRIAAEQYRTSSQEGDIKDLKQRVLVNESLSQQIPAMNQHLQNVSNKLDRLLERSRP